MRAAMIEKPCADATSIEEMVSQKSVSNLWMSAYPLQAKEWKRAGRVRLVGHEARRMGVQSPPNGATGNTPKSPWLIYPCFTPPGYPGQMWGEGL